MTNQKKKTRVQFGKLAPLYRFFLNPYKDARFTKCPQCESKMHQRKLPLVIHVDPMLLLSLNKTCRYCPHCDLLIAHQDDVEQVLDILTIHMPENVGNNYLIIGTQEKPAWKQGAQQPGTTQDTIDTMHDFKEVVTFTPVGGWSV